MRFYIIWRRSVKRDAILSWNLFKIWLQKFSFHLQCIPVLNIKCGFDFGYKMLDLDISTEIQQFMAYIIFASHSLWFSEFFFSAGGPSHRQNTGRFFEGQIPVTPLKVFTPKDYKFCLVLMKNWSKSHICSRP